MLSKSRGWLIGLIFFLLAVLAAAFLVLFQAPPEDTAYLTPIPQQTLAAYQPGAVIETKLQAVIAARNLCCGKANWIDTPVVRLVQETTLSEAQKRVEVPGSYQFEDRPPGTIVWFVVLQGDLQVYPPPPVDFQTRTPTLTILRGGCVYVILQAVDPSSRLQMGGFGCTPG